MATAFRVGSRFSDIVFVIWTLIVSVREYCQNMEAAIVIYKGFVMVHSSNKLTRQEFDSVLLLKRSQFFDFSNCLRLEINISHSQQQNQ